MPKIPQLEFQTTPAGPVDQTGAIERLGSARASVGEAVSGLGSSVTQVGNTIQKAKEQSELSSLSASFAKLRAEQTILLDQTLQQATPDEDGSFRTTTENFLRNLDSKMDELSQKVETRAGQEFFTRNSADFKANFSINAARGQAALTGEKRKQDFIDAQEDRASALLTDPSQYQSVLSDLDQDIELNVANGMNRADAIKLRDQEAERLTKAHIKGRIRIAPNPKDVERDIVDGRYDKLLGGAEAKEQMLGEVRLEERARRADEELRRQELERQRQAEIKVTQNDFMRKFTSGGLTMQMVNDSNLEAFGTGSKDSFRRMLESGNAGKAPVNHALVTELFDKIVKGELTDVGDIQEHFNRGLDKENLKFLVDTLEGSGDELGRTRKAQERAILNGYRRSITKSNDLIGEYDAAGDKQYSEFIQSFYIELRERRKSMTYDKAISNNDGWIDRLALGKEEKFLGEGGVLEKNLETLNANTVPEEPRPTSLLREIQPNRPPSQDEVIGPPEPPKPPAREFKTLDDIDKLLKENGL